MKHCDTLIAPRWCVPVEPAGVVFTEHAVAFTDGRIIELLPLAQARQKYQPSQTIERGNHVLIPGLVNAHTHAAMSLFRGMADDLPLYDWLRKYIWPAEKQWVSAEFVRDGTELAIAEMLRAGVTCFGDQYYFPEIVAETAVDMGMRACVGTPVVAFPTAWANDTDEYLSKAAELVHDAYAEHPLVSTCFAPHSTDALSDAAFKQLRMLADQLDIPVQIHLHETQAEIETAIATNGQRPFARLAELGLVNSSLLAVHAVHVTDEEIGQMAAAGVCVAHCPRSNLKLASGIAPVAGFRNAGVPVGIGTDGAASNNTLDVLSELQTAVLLVKAATGDAAALTAGEALTMATMGGARCLRRDAEIGSIETGKWADFACIDLGALNTQPVYDPVSQIAYAANADQVSDVWIAGRHLLDAGRLTQIDTHGIVSRSNEWRQRISRHIGH